MNIIKKLRRKSKMVIITGSLLFGLTLIPATSFAGNDNHQGNRNGKSQQVNKDHHEGRRNDESQQLHNQQRNHHAENIRERHNRVRHHMKHKRSDHRKHKYSDHGKHRNRHHNRPHYVVINKDHHRSRRLGIQIGVRSGNFDIVFRD
ncbi:hypothetical protein Ping_2796 [Psychromonas ingrahamii 37]|uniref:Uncharacterized protein n=1 Tax=Psychromonas ingrahamii (strain DSM 17664 / CCUG 51855 / 37) TaxID=357804 RepID=A1SYD8_PSYIN|nr:hypothetical protein [Psychromonas ingrahamii]ABM04503.1 hypothetical protein Ping_2796 [Psychromonas ingrahamii 37]